MEAPEQTTLDFSTVPHMLGVPRYLYRKAFRAARPLAARHGPRPPHRAPSSTSCGCVSSPASSASASATRAPAGRRLPASRREHDALVTSTPRPEHRRSRHHARHGAAGRRDGPDLHLQPRRVPRATRSTASRDAGQSRVLLGRARRRQQFDRRDARRRRCRARGRFPVPLRYLFEGRQGKSNALNTGMSAAQRHDHRVHRRRRRRRAGLARRPRSGRCSSGRDIDYTGGPVRPIWGGPPPAVARRDRQSRRHDRGQGSRPRRLRLRGRAQDAARREHGGAPVADRDASAGSVRISAATARRCSARNRRSSSTDRAQAGARGLYVPEMVLDHVVPAARLTRSYFRRWWYWKGVSHARVHGIHGRTELGHRHRGACRACSAFRASSSATSFATRSAGCGALDPAERRGAPSTGSRSPTTPATAGRSGGRRRSAARRAVQTTGRQSSSESPAVRTAMACSDRRRPRQSSTRLSVWQLTPTYFTSNVVITGRWSDGATPLELRTSNTCEALTVARRRALREPHVVDAAVAGVAGVVARNTPPPCRPSSPPPSVSM